VADGSAVSLHAGLRGAHLARGLDRKPQPLTGEAQIGSWELATGCIRYPIAFALNASAALLGLLICPRLLVRAFRRGLRSRNLYGRPFDAALLHRPVDLVQRDLGLTPS